ncbi:hypothetical protein STEG23_020418 [Scotinomys teguina]
MAAGRRYGLMGSTSFSFGPCEPKLLNGTDHIQITSEFTIYGEPYQEQYLAHFPSISQHNPVDRNSQSPWKKRTQEQPVTLRGRGPRRSQSPSEDEPQPLPETQEQPITPGGRGTRSTQTPLEEETSPDPSSKAEMGRCQCKSTYNNIKNKTSLESSPPPTPRPEHCNDDKAEENDLKNSLMKMIEEALEGKMKNAIKEIEEKTNKKLEENNKEIRKKQKKKK